MTSDDDTTGADDVAALVAGHLADEAVWVDPPADLLDRISAEAGTADGGAVATLVGRPGGLRRRRVVRLTAVAAAVVVVVIGFLAGLLVGRDGVDDSTADADEPVVSLELSGTAAAPEARADVEVVARDAGFALYMATTGLDPAPVTGYYEGRLRAADGDEVGVGTFHMRGGDGTVVLWSGVSLIDYPTLVITSHVGDEVMTGTVSDP